MSEEKKSVRWQWVSLVVVVCLLFVCILLLVGRSVRAAPLEAVPSVELAAPEEVIVAAVAAPGQESSAAALPPELAQLIDRDAEPQAMQADVDVAASTWWIGNYARPGGVAVYGVWYGNLEESTLRADGVILTSTLPAGTTYAGDTSGLPPDVGANGVITWTIGTLESGESAIFALTVNVLEDHPTGEGTLGDHDARRPRSGQQRQLRRAEQRLRGRRRA
jgi:hypothetical protein